MSDRLDALAAGRTIEAAYKRYLKTLLAPRDPGMASEFDRIVDASTTLTKGPLLELTPPYLPSRSVRDLVDEGVLDGGMLRIGADVDQPLYRHQENAIRKLVAGRNLVVSTGTGSGKTESFLYPILDSLMRESAAGTLGPGVRALLLYPMNALANDQLARLRGILAPVPEITFGRYTGETKENYRDALALFRETQRGVEPIDNELLSREQMRENPPHILLTNYAMLEYLLLRPADMDLFEGRENTWRFIALDEAHVYDGAQGSEVALLLRRLRQRVASGRPLQCIATSASLDGSGEEAAGFAQALFDAPFEFDSSNEERQDVVRAHRVEARSDRSWRLTDRQLLDWAAGDPLPGLAAHSPLDDPADALHREERIGELERELAAGPVEARLLAQAMWPDDSEALEKLQALVALGSSVGDGSGHPVLSARYHMFVRATEGAYVSFGDTGRNVMLARHESDPVTGRAVFEFGTCQRCGAVHLAGDVDRSGPVEFFRPAAKIDSAVKWLVLTDTDSEAVIDDDEEVFAEKAEKNDGAVRRLCSGCGYLGGPQATVCPNPDCSDGEMLRTREHKSTTKVMSTCTECGARSRQVIRRLHTDANAAPAVITTALYQQLPVADDETVDQVGDGRKLLMFSDSRQAAAFAAPYLERTYGRALERRYLVLALQGKQAVEGDLTPIDLSILAREIADHAGNFPRDYGKIQKEQATNEWVVGELIAIDQRQSLEGLGLLRVGLDRSARPPLSRGLLALGLSEDELWDLVDVLAGSIRLQGAVAVPGNVDITAERFEPRNVPIRMRLSGSDPKKKILSWAPSGRPGTVNNRVRYLQKVLDALGSTAPAVKVLDACWELLKSGDYLASAPDKLVNDLYQIDYTRLRLTNGRDTAWFRCDACRRLTAYSVRGICPHTSCTGALHEYRIPEPGEDSHHYRTLYESLRLAPLTSKEHTAQWQATEAAAIQRQFIEGKVNVLSCSTTFELGVDVGALQSVVLRNMPPKTANYVQRAGRAGRRAASAALVLTYAKRSSHDLAKFAQPQAMIAGHMRIPWIPIENERIGRRHAHSIALAAYFREHWDPTWRFAGAFFSPGDGGSSPAAGVRAFLTPVPDSVEAALRQVLPESVATEIGVDSGAWVDFLVDLLDTSEQDIMRDISQFKQLCDDAGAAKNFRLAERLQKTLRTIEQRQLIGYLANKNVLPKYGFPVDTVELRTSHCPEPVGAQLDLARDLSQAIYDYAPGSQVVAGGRLWTSRGLHTLPKKELPTLEYRVCKNCTRFQCDVKLDAAEVCPSCSSAFGPTRNMIVPEFGFLADRESQDVGTSPPQRLWSGASYVENVGTTVSAYSWPSVQSAAVSVTAGTHATLAVVSEGVGAGFRLCQWCGWAEAVEKKGAPKKHKKPQTGQECTGPTGIVSLAHRYQTDVAEFVLHGVAYNTSTHAQWLSVLYALLEGASESLEISRDDIDGALSWNAQNRTLVLFDTVPAGAGAAKKIAANLETVLQAASDRMARCECGAETSCYGCLRGYRNGHYHDQLSRGAALEVFGKLGIVADGGTFEEPGADAARSGPSSASALSPGWRDLYFGNVDRTLRPLVIDLAAAGVPVPEPGAEIAGIPVELSWPREQVVVDIGFDDADRDALESRGWRVVAPRADALSSALGRAGVPGG